MFGHPSVSNIPIKRAIISGGAGDIAVVAAVAGKKIRVLQFYIRQSAAGTLRWESGAGGTALTGVMVTTTADLVCESGFCPVGCLETVAGQALSLEAATAGAMGWVVYQEV